MKINFMRSSIGLLLGIVLFASCSKDGPAGPAGTANVIYSDWMDLKFDSVKYDQAGVAQWYTEIKANDLAKDLVSNGVVKVFVNANTAAEPVATEVSNIGLTVVFGEKFIQLFGYEDMTEVDPFSTYTSSGNKIFQYRYVLIPGGVKVSSIDWNNYMEVKEALQLQD